MNPRASRLREGKSKIPTYQEVSTVFSICVRSTRVKLLVCLSLVACLINAAQIVTEARASGVADPPPIRLRLGDYWADVVIGQRGFTQVAPYTVVADKTFWNHGVIVDRTDPARNKLYVYDAGNNRILGFDLPTCLALPGDPINCPADIVIGQPDMSSAGCNGDSGYQNYPTLPAPSASSLCGQSPSQLSITEGGSGASMAVDASGNLYVTDFFNHRVLKYLSPFTTDTVADDVWGQDSFTAGTCNKGLSAPNATTLCFSWGDSNNWTAGVDIDPAGNLWVTDSGNNRVLRFPAGSHTADLVFGQPGFTSRAPGSGLNGLYGPTVVRMNSRGSVYVTDQTNNRVLVFDPPFALGMNGRVFGSGFVSPSGIDFDPLQGGVWIMNLGHNVLELWDENTQTIVDTISRRDHTNLLDSTSGSVGIDSSGNKYIAIGSGEYQNDLLQFPPGGAPTTPTRRFFGSGVGNAVTAAGIASGGGVAIADNQLIVADNGRILFWNDPSSLYTGKPADGVTGGVSNFTTRRAGCCNILKADRNHHLYVSVSMEASVLDHVDIYQLPLTTGAQPISTITFPLNVLGGGQLTAGYFQPFWGLVPTPNGDFLWLSHSGTNRVVRLRNPLTNPVVDVILGQTDLTGTSCNRGGQPRVGMTSSTLCLPGSLALDRLGNLYVSDHSLEIQGNMRLLVFDAGLFPPNNTQVIFAPPATKIFPDIATWEPAFDSQNRMVVGYNPYWANPNGGSFPGIYYNPLSPSTTPDDFLYDYYSMAISATFDDNDNLYVGDGNRSRVLVYYHPIPDAPSPTPTGTPSPTLTLSPSPMPTLTRTASPTRTNTPVPTATKTSTPVIPTPTRTSTPLIPTATRTSTRVIPTPTRTSTPGLAFTNISERNITANQATITWTTSGPGTSRVAYGLSSTNLNMTTLEDPALTITHTVTLTNLNPRTRYYYRAYSRDASQREYGSSVSSFKTRPR
jgi:hypothetical protein